MQQALTVASYHYQTTVAGPGDFAVTAAPETAAVWAHALAYRVIHPTSLRDAASVSLAGLPMYPGDLVN